MRFAPPRPRPARDSVLPMINVVFLLLVFFLMSARIAPAPPFDLAPPEGAQGPEAGGERVLWVSAEGALDHDGLVGEAALAALAQGAGPVLLRADGALDAGELARLMARLAALGLDDLRLATWPRGTP